MELFPKLQGTIAATLSVPPASIRETTVDKDISAWDSVGHVNLMMAIEQTFDVQLDVEDFAHLNSIPAILDYLQQRKVE